MLKEANYTDYVFWRWNMLNDDQTLWTHLRLMERGDHGHFAQALYKAMEKADEQNARTLYNAFYELFNPELLETK